MLTQLFTESAIRQNIQRYLRNGGPEVVARIRGFGGMPRIYAVRLEPVQRPSIDQQMRRLMMGRSPLPEQTPRLQVQLDRFARGQWHNAEAVYLRVEERKLVEEE